VRYEMGGEQYGTFGEELERELREAQQGQQGQQG
jgi:hypothetical protein